MIPATDSSSRIGSLVINPGGPGGSATRLNEAAMIGPFTWPEALQKHFDIVGLDPRGVSKSSLAKCDPDIWNERVSYMPNTSEDFDALVDHNQRLATGCANPTGPLIRHISTQSVIRDLDAARAALGDEQITYLGLSYGTQIGHEYAALFPDRVRHTVLDGALGHSQPETAAFAAESTAYETVLGAFFAWRNATDDCAQRGEDLAGLFAGLVAAADEEPIPPPACPDASEPCRADVAGEELRVRAAGLLLERAAWPGLARALGRAADGNATAPSTRLATAADWPRYSPLVIGGADWWHQSDALGDLGAKQRLGAALNPHTGGMAQSYCYQAACAEWPIPMGDPQRYLYVEDAPPILVVNALYDPSTSYEWAVGMREQIEDSVLLTRNGYGHTSFSLSGEATEIMVAKLVNGTMPPASTVVDT
ncbi:Alpha/Beta hydrolase protein [Lineolata rhizophorae]|uniref:Alpha/Beta hydrolase protein n=1 Tax=Lineolata rhizophorae TaxID=578093 RepID=A0A6A6P5E8_9PEZI|nr:Alpha/Beta hydrolase protein [Lineolata rhizophorae]